MPGCDREYVKLATRQSRIRVGTTVKDGAVTKFLRQLEYRVGDDVREVVRFDHDPESEGGHNVAQEGLHMDVYRDGEKSRTERTGPPEPPNRALTRAEGHSAEHAEREVRTMARSEPEPEQRPTTGDEHDQLRDAIEELQTETQEYLADELGGDPEDYRTDE